MKLSERMDAWAEDEFSEPVTSIEEYSTLVRISVKQFAIEVAQLERTAGELALQLWDATPPSHNS